jgi:DNA polymerase-1
MKTQILIDGFYCAYRSFYAFKDFKTSDDRPSGMVFGFTKNLTTIVERWPGSDFIVCWDMPSTWRKDLFPDYKSNRLNKTKLDREQIYACADFCYCVGLTQATADGQEADDVIASLIDESKLNIIFSRDRDFCQLVKDDTVQVYSPRSGNNEEILFTEQTVYDKYGVHPNKLVMYRALDGDASDVFPRMRNFPTKKIAELANNHDTIEEVLDNDKNIKLTPNQKGLLQNFKTQGLLNYQLMKMKKDVVVCKTESKFDKDAATKILNSFELKKINLSVFNESGEGLLDFFE